jgi:probable rRNA maturation factor
MILNQQQEVRVARRPLESFLRRVERELGLKPSDVTVCLVSDKAMARLNQNFRKKKGPTDVLSFPQENSFSPLAARLPRLGRGHSPLYLGDIAISPATARRYAKKQDRPLPSELRVLILHGVLHLLGYDHETDHGEMDKIEQKLRKRFGLI